MNYNFVIAFFLIGFVSFVLIQFNMINAESEIILPVNNLSNFEPRYFAKLENNTIATVIVADPEFILNHMDGVWIETWMEKDNQRKNYAGIGYDYNVDIDSFVPPKQYDSWILNNTSALWEAPIKQPNDDYYWNETTINWVKNE